MAERSDEIKHTYTPYGYTVTVDAEWKAIALAEKAKTDPACGIVDIVPDRRTKTWFVTQYFRVITLVSFLLFFPIIVLSADLTWTPPTTLENGSPITSGILYYTVYHSDTQTGPKTKLADPTSPVFTLNNNDKNKWFHVTATGTGGESQTAFILWTPPAAVTQMKIITVITMGDQ